MLLLYNTGNTAYHQITRDIMIHKKINVLLFKQYFLQWKAERKKNDARQHFFLQNEIFLAACHFVPPSPAFPVTLLKARNVIKK